MKVNKTWSELKALVTDRVLAMQYDEHETHYHVFAYDYHVRYKCKIDIDDTPNADQTDFETNYKPNINKAIEQHNVHGRKATVSSSRPIGTKTTFTGRGDDPVLGIGKGTICEWDASTTGDWVDDVPNGTKTKTIDIKFNEDIWIKEGCIYFFNAPKGCYADLHVVAPAGSYVPDGQGGFIQVPVDTTLSKYIIHHMFQGTCPMGDELNTEEAQENALNSTYLVRIFVTVPITDNVSNGFASFELYRVNTI